jgi:hypothetical protein
MITRIFLLLLALLSRPLLALNETETRALIALIDDRQRNTGDYASSIFMEQKEKDGTSKAFEARVYRRSDRRTDSSSDSRSDKWMILFTAPKTEAGKGYLRLEKNLFLYEPSLGKWQRQTERASLAGTGSRRDDLDEPRFVEDYDGVFLKDEALGQFQVHHLKLTAKPNRDLPTPIIELWVDQGTKNILKRQERALSDKLLRTSYYPGWTKMMSPSKKADVYVPQKIILVDEIEKGNQTTILIKDVSLESLEENIFTKAWLESKSR